MADIERITDSDGNEHAIKDTVHFRQNETSGLYRIDGEEINPIPGDFQGYVFPVKDACKITSVTLINMCSVDSTIFVYLIRSPWLKSTIAETIPLALASGSAPCSAGIREELTIELQDLTEYGYDFEGIDDGCIIIYCEDKCSGADYRACVNDKKFDMTRQACYIHQGNIRQVGEGNNGRWAPFISKYVDERYEIGLLPTQQWHPDFDPKECPIYYSRDIVGIQSSIVDISGDIILHPVNGAIVDYFMDDAAIKRKYVDPNDHRKGFRFEFGNPPVEQGIPGEEPSYVNTALMVPQADPTYMSGGLWTNDGHGNEFPLICYNTANIWIGARATNGDVYHHPGSVCISTGWDTAKNEPKQSITVAVPTLNEDGTWSGVGYGVHHDGYRIKSSTLAGTGNRELYAKSDGTIAARSGTMSKKLGTISVASGATTTALTLTEELEKYKYVMFLLCYNTNGDIPYGQLIMPTANISLFNASTKTAEVSSLSSNSGGDYIRFYVTTTSGKTNKVTITAKSKVSANRYLAVFGLEEL